MKQQTAPGRRRARSAAVLLVLGMTFSSCSSSDDTANDTTLSSPATSTTSAASPEPTPSDPTTAPETAAPTTAPATQSAPTPSGSGCSPGTSDPAAGLPDGRWFVYVGPVPEAAGPASMTFDLACWFAGEDAVIAAAEDGDESPPPNDYHVRNDNDLLRVQPVASTATVSWMPDPGDPRTTEVIPYLDWLDTRLSRSFQPGVWLTIESGEVRSIEEQFVP